MQNSLERLINIMKVKNTSTFPKTVSGTRLEPGETGKVEEVSEEDLPVNVEPVEKSGESSSDQNTKTEKSEEQENSRGEN